MTQTESDVELFVLKYVGRWLWVPAFAGTTNNQQSPYTPSATTM
jgi:hypothetical protein